MKKNFTLLLLTLPQQSLLRFFMRQSRTARLSFALLYPAKNSTLYCLAIRIQLEMAREIITDQTNATAAVTTGRIFI